MPFLLCYKIGILEVRDFPLTLLLTSIPKHGNDLLNLVVQILAIATRSKNLIYDSFTTLLDPDLYAENIKDTL